MTVGGVAIEVTRKTIKHFHLKIRRDDGRVCVSAPRRMTDAMIRTAVAFRLDWIHRQLERLETIPREPVQRFVSGERHDFRGRSCVLEVSERPSPPGVRFDGDQILELQVRPGTDAAKRRTILERWYRRQLSEEIPALVRRWERVLGVSVAEWRIKRMKTRWGTCNTTARRIWLNLELAKQPPECLEYVVVHEMVHLLERGHNARFYGYMDRFLPQWRASRDRLHACRPA